MHITLSAATVALYAPRTATFVRCVCVCMCYHYTHSQTIQNKYTRICVHNHTHFRSSVCVRQMLRVCSTIYIYTHTHLKRLAMVLRPIYSHVCTSYVYNVACHADSIPANDLPDHGRSHDLHMHIEYVATSSAGRSAMTSMGALSF